MDNERKYFIECVVNEIRKDEKDFYLKIKGVDGFFSKLESGCFNLFFPCDCGKSVPADIKPCAIILKDSSQLKMIKSPETELICSERKELRFKIEFSGAKPENGVIELNDARVIAKR